jgi:ketosteroid isomerase-like protein
MSRERVEQLIAGYAAFNRGDLDVGLEGVADDVSWEVLDVFPDRGPFHGREGVLQFWASWAETFSEFRAEIEEVIDVEDDVIVVMHVSGRGHGSDAPMRTPTFAQIWTWKGDHVARVRMVSDKDEALSLIGNQEP